ncbi:uncharacterized protein LOC142597595, partial [Dermatophagoides farinae]|uniref:uncharacterized protein LOC142597595 n=1 Tax=Dermatophagoides farinae TaxID=6954 RepID=UPI003F63A725
AIKPPGRPGPSERTLRRLGRQIEITLATASKELASHMDVSANTVRKYIPMLEYGARIICHCYLKKQKQTPAMGKCIPSQEATSHRETQRHGGRSELRLCSNGMNSEEYINMLETTLFPIFRDRRNKVKKRNFLFQEDGAPCHMSKRSQDFIKKSNIKKLEWVAQSPDMNPIEHLWYSLKRRLKQTKLHPSTPVGLFELLVK